MVMVCMAILGACFPSTNRVAAVPANLVATGDVAAIGLTWDASIGATGYVVKRATSSSGAFVQIASTAATSYTDSKVSNGVIYYYVVSSLAPDGESADSGPASASPLVIPPVPGNVVATAGDAQVELGWSASDGAASYIVKRGTSNLGPFTQVATTTTPSYVDASVVNGTAYFYVVSAVNRVGESADSARVRAMPNVQNPPPTVFGTWTNVTPSGVDLLSPLCGNAGVTTVQVDPARPSDLYTLFQCQGIWKSTDYGATWSGPLNTGTNGAAFADCAGGITIAPGSTAAIPTLYAACIRGGAVGFWRSLDGGVSWARHVVAPTVRQDYFPPVVDPHDRNHLLMRAHEFDSIVESYDGGLNWHSVSLAAGMAQGSLSPSIFFINTGNAVTTRSTWLWIGDQSGGGTGTWRTADAGSTWTRVDSNEQFIYAQIYQPDTSGAVFMAGAYSEQGHGVLRSNDYGQTWFHVGLFNERSVVTGTSKNVYSMRGTSQLLFEVGAQPGTGTWVAPQTPTALQNGPAQIAVVNNGTSNILVGAMFNSGLWRYVEP